jgi:hypothetical protein
MSEIWRDIKESNGYQISNIGRVRSSKKAIIKHRLSGKYNRVTIKLNNLKRKNIRIVELVKEAFPEYSSFMDVIINLKPKYRSFPVIQYINVLSVRLYYKKWNSVIEASNETGIHPDSIVKTALGKRGSAGNCYWEFASKE